MKKTISKVKQNEDGSWEFPEGTYGHIRLWIESDPPAPTDLWILIGDSTADKAKFKAIKSKDSKKVEDKMNAIFKRAKVELRHYGNGRTFHMDIQVPKELIDGYAD